MNRIIIHILVWVGLYGFWLWVSADRHPTLELNAIVTGLMLIFYAAAVYLNLLVVVPTLWYDRKRWQYFVALAALLILLNVILLSLIRYAYSATTGDHPLGGYWLHFAIDLFGMVLHVAVAALVSRNACRFRVEWD